MKTWLVTTLLLFASAAPAATPSGTADVAPQVRERVQTYLSAIDTPIPPARWRALGEPAVQVLEEIARSSDELPTRRARAVSAAGIIGGERAHRLVLELLAPAAAPPVVRQSAVRALGAMCDGAELTRILPRVMRSDPSLSVRAAAASVLAARAPQACGHVRTQAGTEAVSARAAYARALKRCRAARR